MMPVFAGIPILGVNYGGTENRAPPGCGGRCGRCGHHIAAVIHAPTGCGREMRAALFFPDPKWPFPAGTGMWGDTWMGDASFMVRGGLD